jgi:hypothetical protein
MRTFCETIKISPHKVCFSIKLVALVASSRAELKDPVAFH